MSLVTILVVVEIKLIGRRSLLIVYDLLDMDSWHYYQLKSEKVRLLSFRCLSPRSWLRLLLLLRRNSGVPGGKLFSGLN